MKSFSLLFILLLFVLMPASLFSESMSELNIDTFEKQVKTSQTAALKNPFAPDRPAPSELSSEDLYLTGIAVGSGGQFALINGFIFSEGDAIAGLRIRAITKNKVVLQHLDRVHTLYLNGGL